jgi:hypothetical protein
MGLFGLSNKAVSFLGGVASGVEEVIDKDEAYTNELVKDSASMIIKARLDSKERRRQRVSEYSKEMSQLVAVGYGKQESAGIVSQGLTNDFIKLAKTTPKDKLNTLYKVTSKYDGALSVSDLSEAIVGKYKQPTIDLSGIPKRGTFLSAIGIEGDPSDKIKQRVESLSPTESDSTVDFDALASALSGNVTPKAQELLRSESGTLTASKVKNDLQRYIVGKLGGDLSFIGGEPKFNVQRVSDKNFSEELSAKYISLWRSLVRSGNYNKEEAYEEILKRIKEDQELATQGTLKVDNNKKIGDADPENLIPEKPKGDGNKKPVIPKVPENVNEIAKILKEQITGANSEKFKKLDSNGKAKFRQQFIKQLIEIGGMNRERAIAIVKKYFP